MARDICLNSLFMFTREIHTICEKCVVNGGKRKRQFMVC